MTITLDWQHCRQLGLNCQSDVLKFNTKYETASQQLYPSRGRTLEHFPQCPRTRSSEQKGEIHNPKEHFF
jgi:hypothetical protein